MDRVVAGETIGVYAPSVVVWTRRGGAQRREVKGKRRTGEVE